MTTAPMNPLAGVSGPGPYAVRTDKLDMGSTSYGEGKETKAIKSAEPLAKTPDTRPAPASAVREAAMADNVVPLYAPTQRPDEPITAGIAMGGGVGPEGLMMTKQAVKTSDTLAKMLPFDTTGEIGILYQQALARGD